MAQALEKGAAAALVSRVPEGLGEDAPLLVEATSSEPGRALWGPHPSGPYSLEDARSAMREWDPLAGGQVSVGVLRDGRLGAAGACPAR